MIFFGRWIGLDGAIHLKCNIYRTKVDGYRKCNSNFNQQKLCDFLLRATKDIVIDDENIHNRKLRRF